MSDACKDHVVCNSLEALNIKLLDRHEGLYGLWLNGRVRPEQGMWCSPVGYAMRNSGARARLREDVSSYGHWYDFLGSAGETAMYAEMMRKGHPFETYRVLRYDPRLSDKLQALSEDRIARMHPSERDWARGRAEADRAALFASLV